jgi:glycosyltransferase involved in cell wall biosynthesis
MRNLLFLESSLPFPISHGGFLRVFNLARELSGRRECHLAVLAAPEPVPEPLRRIFRSVRFFPPPSPGKSWHRLFRATSDRYWEPSSPEFFHDTVGSLRELIETHDIDTVLATSIYVAEFLRPLQGVGKVVDACDCLTLARERAASYGVEAKGMDPRGIAEQLDSHLIRRIESGLTRHADLVTTVSPVDQARLRSLNGYRPEAIQVVPNGVAVEFFRTGDEEPAQERAIIFWGVLDFPPNRTAVWLFYENVFVPFLRSRNVHWYIVGRNPPAGILELGEREPNVAVLGYVDDLIGLVRRIPIVINPMVIGSGLKNKVLEAFALGRLVISTSLGVEALDVENGIDCVVADDPEEFARRILHFLDHPMERRRITEYARRLVLENYTWEKIVARLEQLVEKYAATASEKSAET